ncbi:LapA family protein [Rhodobacteraceae bacterium]|nr:LapA family protein [Paracoccaceae bacterium]
MIRALRFLVLAVVAIILIVIALSNTQIVTLRLLPQEAAGLLGLSWSVEVPLFVALVGSVLVGLLVGFVWEWARERRIRKTASVQQRKAKALEREVEQLRDRHQAPKDDVLAVLESPNVPARRV